MVFLQCVITHPPLVPRAAPIPAAERRLHAVQALLELAQHSAPDQISTAAIAERMGVSHAALFRHFPSRDALWQEAVGWAVAEIEQRFAQPSGSACPLDEVRALMARHAGFLHQHPGLVRMLFAELQRPVPSPAREMGQAFMQRFRLRLGERLAAAQAAGALAPGADPAELAGLLVATQQGLMLQALAYDSFADLPQRSARSVGLLLSAGPAAAPAATPTAPPAETAGPPGETHRRRRAARPAGPPVD